MELKALLQKYAPIAGGKKVQTASVAVKDYTCRKLYFALLGLGRILEEDLQDQHYVTTVRIGIARQEALLVARLNGETIEIAAYAKEGLIPQHLAKKAIALVTKRLTKT